MEIKILVAEIGLHGRGFLGKDISLSRWSGAQWRGDLRGPAGRLGGEPCPWGACSWGPGHGPEPRWTLSLEPRRDTSVSWLVLRRASLGEVRLAKLFR